VYAIEYWLVYEISLTAASGGNYTCASKMTVTKEQLAQERIDLLYRDNCAGLLIPLNR
jgi:hypothetical protein